MFLAYLVQIVSLLKLNDFKYKISEKLSRKDLTLEVKQFISK